jgi:two-component system, cell cycle response regulator CtrA
MHPPSIIEIGAIRLNVESKIVEVNGQRVRLTSMEYQLLERLALRKGITLTKEMMLNHLYGGMDREPKLKIIDVFICKLRRKLRTATGGPHYIETVWGRGYALRDPAERTVSRAVRARRVVAQLRQQTIRPASSSPLLPLLRLVDPQPDARPLAVGRI